MKITGTETLSQLVNNFANAKGDKHLRYETKGNETTLKIHTGAKPSGIGQKSAQRRDAKHKNALSFVRSAMVRQYPGEQDKIDHLLSKIGGDKISVRQLRKLELAMAPPLEGHHEVGIGENSSTSSGSRLNEIQIVNIGHQEGLPEEIDFSGAKNFKTHSSGHGGALELEVGGKRLAVKDHANAQEVYGARLARELGLPAPETRLLSTTESEQLAATLRNKGQKMPGGKSPVVVMEFVSGTGLEKPGALEGQDPKNIARQMGRWLAFDALINEGDRFNGFGLNFNGVSGGINSSNFIVGHDGTITGIDQNAGRGHSNEPVDNIVKGNVSSYMAIGNALSKFLPGSDFEVLGDHIREGAEEMFKHIGSTLTPEKLDELAQDIGADQQSVNKAKERLQRAVEFAR